MVLRIVERREVEPVGLDLRAIGDVEADRAEYRLGALPSARNRMHAATPPAAARQRDIQRFFGKARVQLGVGKRGAARVQRGFDRGLRSVDRGAARLLLCRRQSAERLQQRGELAPLAQEACLGVLERSRIRRSGEIRRCAGHDAVDVFHPRTPRDGSSGRCWP